ncbi:ESPR-type extended signal peptide-containing protein [Acinetobacter baumannii]|nr:ESPR-type extended signal peptide-containing protein [Acinetobacter baumannii]WNX59033.1 ESPR-type extended signal peptide-containing protein [Acinetobacter baumannii]
MNKIYKVVWNASIGTWIVVSELAKSKTRTGSVSSSSEITGSQNEIVSKEKKFRPKALVLSIISCLAVSHVWADYTNLYGSIIDTSPTISNGIAIGANTGTPATANDSNGLAVGSRANASAADSTALGNYVNATGVNSTVVGGQASAAGAQSIALQNNSDADLVAEGLATGSSFTAVDSASSYSVAIGAMSQVVGSTAAMAIGKNAQVNSGANNATAIGNTATVDTNAVDGVAIGTNSLTSAANSVALGPRSTANVTNSVALGAGSTTTVQSGNSYITNVAASTTNGVVSVGSATNTRRIQNVADGAADSDAVTVAQLKDVNNRAVGNTTALGGGAAYNPATDVYTPPSYTITKTDGTTYTPVNTVSGALTNLNNEVVKPITFAGNTGSSANNLGTTLNITGGGSTAGTYSGNNLKTAVTGNTVNIQMADAPVFSGTVTAGNLTTGGSLNVTGASNLNGGANLNNQKITNLAAGTISSTSTDAVNGSQLNTTNQNVTTAQNTANTAVTNAAAAQNTANTAVTNAAAAQATADKGLNFSVNGGTADNVKLGETVNFANGTNTTAVYDPATNTYKYNVNDNIALTNAGSLTVGNSKVDNSGLTITGGPSVTTAGINAGNQKITNVAAGTISSTSTDAVNGSQLNTTNQNVTTAQNTANTAVTNAAAAQATADKGLNFSVNGGTADNVKLGEMVNFADGTNTTAVYDPATNTYKYNVNDNIALTNAGSLTVGNTKVDNSGLTITGGPSVTTAGINAGNQKITNVTAGTISATSTDAVNGSQLNTTNQNVTTAQNTANTAVTNAAAAQNTANTAVTNAAAAQATADKGLNFSVNGGTADNVKLGETVNFADGTNTTAVYDPATNTYKYNVNDNIALTNAGSLTVGNTKVDNSGLTITGGPSVTTAGINAGNQKITNVTAGTISATSTDAVNGSQLNTTNQNVTTAQNTANTAVTNAAAAQNTANTAVTNAAAAQATADKGLNFSVNGGTADNVKLGETVNFADGTNTTAVYDSATNTYKYNVNDNIALTNAGSLTVGNTKVDNSGLTITGGPSVTTAGINAGNQKITNVAAGTNATDAVNVSQLDALSTSSNNKTDALGNSTANNLGGGASYDSTTGAVSSPTYTVNGNNVNNVGDAITALDKGWTLQSNGTNAAAVKAGDTVDIGTVAGETNLKVTKTGNTIQYGLNRDLNIDSVTAGDSKLDTNGLTIAGGPSVTKTGIDAAGNTISNVAAGTNATDAVNKGQLDALSTSSNNKTDALGNSTANNLGGGSSYDSTTGAVSSPTYVTTKTDGTTVNANNVGDALTNLNNEVVKPITFAGNSGSVDRKLGETLNITGGLTASGSNSNVKTVISGNTVDIQLADAPVFAGKLTANGLDANGEKVTNVGAGTAATDAVNKGQLDALSTSSNNKTDALGNSTANNLGGGASYDSTTGAVSSPTYTVNGNNVNNVGDAITALDKGWTLQSNGTNAAAVKAGDTVDIGTVAGETNLKVTKTGNTIQYGLNRDLNIDSVTAGDSKLDTNGLTIAGGPSVTKTGIDAAGNTIGNVAAGTNATDAVNKGQLDALSTSSNNKTDALGNSTANNLGGGASYDSTTGAVSSPTYVTTKTDGTTVNANNVGDALTNLNNEVVKPITFAGNSGSVDRKLGETLNITGGLTASGSNSNVKTVISGNTVDIQLADAPVFAGKLTANGLDANGEKVTNVGAGTAATDAVNKGQLDALSTSSNNKTDALGNSTANNLGGGASYDSTTGAVSSPTYTVNGNNVNNVGDAITALDKGWTLQSNGTNAAAVKAGDTVDIGTVAGETNLKVTKTGNTIQYGLNRDLNIDSVTAGDSKLDTNGLTIAGGPSVTKTGIDAAGNTIGNVAAGTNATDAVNKGQLDALSTSSNNKTDALGNSTANNLGGGASYDSTTGAVSSPTYVTTKTDGTTVNANNVGDALTNLNNEVVKPITFAGNSGSVDRKLGETLNITGGLTASGSNSNVKTVISGNTVDIQLADAPVFAGKLTANGLDANGEKVTNVGAGTAATDAVNKGQLDALSTSSNNKTDALGNSTANNLGGGASYDSTTGAVSSPTYTVNGNNVNNVGDAITALDKGWTLQSNGTNAAAVKAGDTVDIGTVAGETNLKVTKTGNTIQYGLNRDLNIDSVTAGDSKLDTNGLTIAGGPSVTKTGIDAAGNTIGNVAAGTNATDAVNKGQLDALSTSSNNKTDALGNSTANNLGGGASYDSTTGAVSSPTYVTTKTDGTTVNANNVGDALTNLNNEVVKPITFAGNSGSVDRKLGETLNITGGLTASGSNSNVKTVISGNTVDIQLADAPVFAGKLTANGLDANGEKVTNVGAGTAATDAVNKGQLDALSTSSNNKTDALGNSTANNLGGGASYDSTTGAVSSPTYTVNGNNVNNVGDAITALDKGWTLQSNGTNAAAVKAGDTVDIGTVAGETNLKVTKTGNTIQYGLNRDLNIDSVTAGDSKLDTNGLTIAGGPSVTKTGIDAAGNTIGNVAAGTNATDAVNKGQLDALSTSSNNKTDALGNSTANNLGGGASYDSTTGAVSSPTYVTTKTDGTTVNANNVGDALTNLNNEVVKPITFAGNSGSVDRKLGETLNITGGLTASGSNSNVKTVISGNTVDIQLADAPVFAGKLTANGLDANGEKVTNVGAGTAATDAVNKGQLDALSTSSNNKTDALGNSTANNLGGGASYDSTTGAVSSPTYTVNGNNVNNVGDAITALDKGWTLQSNGTNAAAVKAGDTVDIGTVAGETNLKVTKTGNTIQYGLNRDLNIDSVTAGDSKLDTNGLTIAGGPSVTKTGIDAAGNTISNVAAGTNATDAVNKGQLDALSTSSNNKTDALGNSTANNLGGGSSYDSTTGAVSSPTYTVNGNNVNNVGDAITALDKGWTLQSNGTNAAAVKAGDTVDIGTVAGETNLNVTKTGNTIQYGLNRDLNIDSVTAGDSKLDTNGLTIAGGPSVTKTGIDAAGNTISNVAAGTNATDAVNKGQLDHVDNRVTQVTNTTASIFGGGAKANTDGSISNPTYNVAGTSANNVGDALTALDKAVTDAGTAANAGWTVSANGDAATAKKIKPNGKVNFTGDDNLTVAQSSETDNEGNIKVALNKNLKVDSVTTGNTVIDTTGVKVGDNVQLGSTGLIIAGGPSITTSGISAGNKTISNVAAGVSSTDAVNKGQLDSAISSINNNVGALANSAVQYDKNSDGSVNKDSITLAGGANGTTIKNVANGTVAEGSKDAVNGGQLWTVQQQVNKNTGDISNLQTDISNINNGKSGLVQQADKDAAITVGKDTGGTQVNVAGTAGERTVTGVKAGAVTESSKDAVNGSQLNTTNQALVNYLGGGAGYDNITQSFSNPTYNVGDQSYHNVGDAIGALNQADQTLNTKIDNVSNKLEQAFYATNQRIDDVEKRANAGIAAAMALENAPFVAGKYTYAVGAAYHGGENAVGVTLRKTADNGRWSLTGGVAAASQGDPSVRIGISGVID